VRHTGPASQADLAQAPPLPQPRDPRTDPVFTSHAIPDPGGFKRYAARPSLGQPGEFTVDDEHRRIEVTEPGWFQALLRQPG
jgi:hypothetical protein